MTNSTLPNDIVTRILKRRRAVDIYDEIIPKKTALVVIDMQNAFCEPGGVLSVKDAKAIIPNINRIATSLRDRGGSVYWITIQIKSKQDWPVYLEDIVSLPDITTRTLEALKPSGAGVQLDRALDVKKGDTCLAKNRFSAFLSEACDLHRHLQDASIDTVIITGTLTTICCESSARDAAMLNYRVIFVSDANIDRNAESHERTLETISVCFGDVRSTEAIINMLRQHPVRSRQE